MYVHEVPADFTSGTHQRRSRDHDCVPRTYKGDAARFTAWYYSLEATFHEYLMRSAHGPRTPPRLISSTRRRTSRVTISSTTTRVRGRPPRRCPEPRVRPHGALLRWRALAAHLREPAVPEIAAARSARGFAAPDEDLVGSDLSDHIFVAPYDEGACAVPEELRAGTFLVHWGNTGEAHAESTTGFGNDDWSGLVRVGILPPAADAPMRCYDPAKDLVVPPWNRVRDPTTSPQDGASAAAGIPSRWARGRRPTLFFFAGTSAPPRASRTRTAREREVLHVGFDSASRRRFAIDSTRGSTSRDTSRITRVASSDPRFAARFRGTDGAAASSLTFDTDASR